MAKPETLLDLLDRMAPQVAAAFQRSIDQITSDVQLAALEAAIARGDIAAVLAILNLDQSYFGPLDRALGNAYVAGGEAFLASLVAEGARNGYNFAVRFDGRNERAEEWLKAQSSNLIREVVEDQREAVRDLLQRATEEGRGPRSVALDLVGRIDRRTGRRTGGVVGLLSDHIQMSTEMYSGLRAGDPDQMRRYIRSVRDSRFTHNARDLLKVKAALAKGEGLGETDAAAIISRWRAATLKRRGETIARTEVLASLHHAQDTGLVQLVESGKLPAEAIELEWDASEDSATRPTHRALDGVRVKLGGLFVTLYGQRLAHPGDRSHGASGGEVINCRCRLIVRVDWTLARDAA